MLHINMSNVFNWFIWLWFFYLHKLLTATTTLTLNKELGLDRQVEACAVGQYFPIMSKSHSK